MHDTSFEFDQKASWQQIVCGAQEQKKKTKQKQQQKQLEKKKKNQQVQ